MQTNQNQTREDVEAAIEDSKEIINKYKYKLRWFTRFACVFWIGVFIAPISFIAVNAITPFNVPIVNSILIPVGVITVISTILVVSPV